MRLLTWLARLTGFTMLAVLTRFALLAGFTMLTSFAVLTMLARRLLLAGLGLRRNEAGLLAKIRKALAVIVEIVRRRDIVDVARHRLVLTELLLGSGNQSEIVLGVLIVVLRRDGIAGGAGVARELNVFLGHM